MLKAPVTINIVPSRLALGGELCLVAVSSLVIAFYAPLWLTIIVIMMLAGVVWRDWRRDYPWALRWVPGIDGGWQQRLGPGDQWRAVSVRCDYLGPWLIGLRIAGRHRWLWPDSATEQQRRALRRVLLWSKAQASSIT